MQPQAKPPMTPYEEHITQSYQMLNAARVQSGMLYHSANFCLDRCLDTEELYTLLRTTQAPIRYRLQKDLEEKQCVQHCGAKWDEMYRMTLMNVNEGATREVQASAMSKMLQMMQQQQHE